ncbi:hypothetical protein D3C79_1001400 [compost metagenome]
MRSQSSASSTISSRRLPSLGLTRTSKRPWYMLDSATFSRMGSDDPGRPLVWISELASPGETITMRTPL